MSKRTVFTTITPLPAGLTRATVLSTLHSHIEMIDLNPLVETRTPMPKPPARATAEEYHCAWYELVDKIQYLPGGLYSGRVTYHACFNDLADGVQTAIYAPLGLSIRERWAVGGNAPGEPRMPTEFGLGMPKEGLWLREDCDMRCNVLLQRFVKSNLVKAHKVLVDRLVEKAQLRERDAYNESLASASISSPTSSRSLDRFSRLRTTGSEWSLRESLDPPYANPPHDWRYMQQQHNNPAEMEHKSEPAELPANEQVTHRPYDPSAYGVYQAVKQPLPFVKDVAPPAVSGKLPVLLSPPTEGPPPVPEKGSLPYVHDERPPTVPEKSPRRDFDGLLRPASLDVRRTFGRDLVYP